jgi:2-hydroxychromene-2-carboxylate isomerase
MLSWIANVSGQAQASIPTWVAAVAAVTSAIAAWIGTHVSGRVAQARLDATLAALEDRVRMKSGEVDAATAGIISLSGRVTRAETDIESIKADVRETRDNVRALMAKLE